jgi:Xaa-Pro aminopeptidase
MSAIPRPELERRWDAFNTAFRDKGYDGAVVWSRAGTARDAFYDVVWLTNHYSPFPSALPNEPAYGWLGAGMAAVVSDFSGEPTLCLDFPDWRPDDVSVEDVVAGTGNLPAVVALVLRDRGLARGRVALVGLFNALLAKPYLAFRELMPDLDLVDEDHLMNDLRRQKSAWEVERMRAAGQVGQASLEAILEVARTPGRTEAEAISAGYASAVKEAAIPYDAYTASGPNTADFCTGRNPGWTTRRLQAGDLFHVDWSGFYENYLWDCGRTVVVGDKPTPEQDQLRQAVADTILAGAKAFVPGATAGDVHAAMARTLVDHGASMEPEADNPDNALRSSTIHGHGIGLMTENPYIIEGLSESVPFPAVYALEAQGEIVGVGSAMIEQDYFFSDAGPEALMSTPLVP